MTHSERCETGRHFDCTECGCGCHPERALYDQAADYGQTLGVDPLKTRDLISHLRSGAAYLGALTVEQAARVVRKVVDLGWRPSAPADPPVDSPPIRSGWGQ